MSELIKNSVRREELQNTYGITSPWHFIQNLAAFTRIEPDLPPYWTPARDNALWAAAMQEGTFANAINIAATKMASFGYEVDGDVASRVRRARELLGNYWPTLMRKTVQDFLTFNNGAFWEVVRATKSPASRVIGFMHLSSRRCIRTGDERVPVLYIDKRGKAHEMKAHQVVMWSDMPDDDFLGVGRSAADRVYDTLYMVSAARHYFKEKVAGRKALALHLVKGFGRGTIEQGIEDAEHRQDSEGALAYGGVVIIPDPNDGAASSVKIDIAGIPDHFDWDKTLEAAQIEYAAATGLDPTDLNPRLIGNRQLGAGAQAQVLDDKTRAKGLVALRQEITAFLNDTETWHPLPNAVKFAFVERDARDEASRVANASARAQVSKTRIESGITQPAQELQVLVDAGDLPEQLLARDLTDAESLTDEDKSEVTDGATESVAPALSPVSDAGAVAQVIKRELMAALAVQDEAGYINAVNKATQLLTVGSSKTKRGIVGKAEAEYLKQVTRDLDEYGSVLVANCLKHMPQDEGVTAQTLKYQISNRNARGVTLRLLVGNKERPDVAIRAVLFGRKAFRAKGNKPLVFTIDGRRVFARAVRSAPAQDWLTKGLTDSQSAFNAMQERLAQKMATTLIDVSDIPGAKKITRRTNPPKAPKKRKKEQEGAA
jgi:hypothetical protein